MHLMYFTEQPMSAYPAQAGLEFGATALMFSNRHFDPVAGSRLYNEYLEQYILADELGIDGIMLNEHHNAPFCMQAKCNVFASILAAVTKQAKIVLLGNPLPLADNPIRLAEELAMIDMISKGRLVSGFVRGGGAGAARRRRQPRLQPRALRGGARPRRENLDDAGPLPLGGLALPAPRRQSVGDTIAKTAPTHLDPRRHQPRDHRLGSAARLSLYRTQHAGRAHTADLAALRQRRRRGRLHRRPRLPRPAEADPRRRNRGKSHRERPPVHVDAGRVHRPGAPRLEHARGLRQPGEPPRLRRVRYRPFEESRGTARRWRSSSRS